MAETSCVECGRPSKGLAVCWRCYTGKATAKAEPPVHRIGKGAWSDYEEPLFVAGPTDGLVRFGAQPGWSPSREGQKEIGCGECGGVLVFDATNPDGPVPTDLRQVARQPSRYALVVPEDDPLTGGRLCPSCMRWAKDNWLARLVDREYAQRGSNAPVPVQIAEGGAVPLSIA